MTTGTPNKNDVQELYSIKEAAAFLRISRATLYRIRLDGKISFRRIGSVTIVFTHKDLDEYLERQKTKAFAV